MEQYSDHYPETSNRNGEDGPIKIDDIREGLNRRVPRTYQLRCSAVGWLADEIEAWLIARVEATRGPKSNDE